MEPTDSPTSSPRPAINLKQVKKICSKAPPVFRMDPASPAEQYALSLPAVQLFFTALDPKGFAKPLASASRTSYAGSVRNFVLWCAHEGLIADPEEADLLGLEFSVLQTALEDWLLWRTRPCDLDHPLCVEKPSLSTKGLRTPTTPKTVRPLLAAIEDWAQNNGLTPLATAVSTALARKSTGDEASTGRPLTLEEIQLIAESLYNNDVLPLEAFKDAKVHEAWHCRQLAAFALAIAGSMRTGEPSRLRDTHIVKAEPKFIVLGLPNTKPKKAREMQMNSRGDLLCPIWNLKRWLTLCLANNWDRDAYLLPMVARNASGSNNPLRKPGLSMEAKNWKRMTHKLGIRDTGTGVISTAQGLRKVLPKLAGEAGWSIFDIAKLGGWASLDVAAGYAEPDDPTYEDFEDLDLDLENDNEADSEAAENLTEGGK